MKKLIAGILAFIVLISGLIISGCKLYTIVPMEGEKAEGLVAEQKDQDLDPEAYVEGVWQDIVDYSVTNAHNLDDVYAAFIQDKQQCISDYSSAEVSEADTATFIVKSQVKILEINRDSKAGRMCIDIMPYDGVVDAYVQIGSVYRLNTVRDTMPFITFEDFKNQLAFGDVGKAINSHIDAVVVVPFAVDDRVGQEIIVTGVFADGEEVLITPIVFETAEP